MREQQDSPPGLDSTVTAEAEEQGEAKGRRMEEREAPDAAASGMRACVLASFDLAIMLRQCYVLWQYIPVTSSVEVWKVRANWVNFHLRSLEWDTEMQEQE